MKKLLVIMLTIFVYAPIILKSQLINEWEVVSDTVGYFTVYDANTFGFYSKGLHSKLTITKDFGKTWKSVIRFNAVDTLSYRIYDVVLFNENKFMIFGDSVVTRGYDIYGNGTFDYKAILMITEDGGENWEKIEIDKQWRSRPSTVFSMLDSLEGIIIQQPSNYNAQEKSDRILYTQDGWETYEIIETPEDMKASDQGAYLKKGYIVTRTAGYNDIFITHNFGQSWDKIHIPDSLPFKFGPKINFVSDSNFYYITKNALYKSTDLGKSWVKLYSEKGNTFLYIKSYEDTILCLSSEKYFLCSTNSGKDWIKYNNWYIDGYEVYISDFVRFSANDIFGKSALGLLKYTNKKTLKPPEFLRPSPIAYINPYNVELEWEKIQGANHYQLQIVKREGNPWSHMERPPASFDTILYVNDSLIEKTVYPLGDLEYYMEYYCRIRAFNDSLTSPWLRFLFWTKEEGTNVEENTLTEDIFTIYPNPSDDELNIELSERFSGYLSYSIYGINGIQMKAGKVEVSNNKLKIDTRYLTSGMYYVRIITGSKIYTKRFIVYR